MAIYSPLIHERVKLWYRQNELFTTVKLRGSEHLRELRNVFAVKEMLPNGEDYDLVWCSHKDGKNVKIKSWFWWRLLQEKFFKEKARHWYICFCDYFPVSMSKNYYQMTIRYFINKFTCYIIDVKVILSHINVTWTWAFEIPDYSNSHFYSFTDVSPVYHFLVRQNLCYFVIFSWIAYTILFRQFCSCMFLNSLSLLSISERATQTVCQIGPAIWHGAVTTFLVFFVLIFGKSLSAFFAVSITSWCKYYVVT